MLAQDGSAGGGKAVDRRAVRDGAARMLRCGSTLGKSRCDSIRCAGWIEVANVARMILVRTPRDSAFGRFGRSLQIEPCLYDNSR